MSKPRKMSKPVCNMISATVVRAGIKDMDRAQMDQNTNKLVDYLGACDRHPQPTLKWHS